MSSLSSNISKIARSHKIRISREAVLAMQTATYETEQKIVDDLQRFHDFARHAQRKTIFPADVQLARALVLKS